MATVMNYDQLSAEIDRATTVLQCAKEKFIGFRVPSNIALEYVQASNLVEVWGAQADSRSVESQEVFGKALRAYQIARRNLENLLVGFFRNSGTYFTKRLDSLQFDADLHFKRLAIKDEVRSLRAIASEKWIDLTRASGAYYEMHQKVEHLVHAQVAREEQRKRARIAVRAHQGLAAIA